jgi:DNA polymerase-3 subunit beta
MRFSVSREALLKPLQQIFGAVERRQTMPMLSNVLLRSNDEGASLTATDLEVELVAKVTLDGTVPGEVTLPARKLLDICRNLPEGANLAFDVAEGKATIRAMRTRFVLATLPAADFPSLGDIRADRIVTLAQAEFKHTIDQTAFAMAQQDVRYYLNGLLLQLGDDVLRCVATDGHRLATAELTASSVSDGAHQVIVPRKGVQELQRLLTSSEHDVQLELSSNHIRVRGDDLCFTSKLIDGRFPDYERVLPKDSNKTLTVDRESLRQALTRAAILSSEKFKGVRLSMGGSVMRVQSHNPDQEEAEEEIEVDYAGESLEIGFNVTYLLDVLNVMEGDSAEIRFKDANSSALIKALNSDRAVYVVMPMRL